MHGMMKQEHTLFCEIKHAATAHCILSHHLGLSVMHSNDRQPNQTEEVQVYVDEVLEHKPAALHEKDKSAHVSNTDLDIRNPRVHGRSVHAEGHRRVMCT